MKISEVILYLSIIQLLMSCTVNEESNKVKLSGQLINFSDKVALEDFSSIGKVFKTTHEIKTDSAGMFELEFQLNEPKYFRLGRNQMYLYPGDVLNVIINKDEPQDAKFEGDNASINDYLKDKPFPKGGSYSNAGYLFRKVNTDSEFLDTVYKIHKEHVARFKKIKTSDQKLISMEKLRLQLNLMNTFLTAPYYKTAYVKDREDAKQQAIELESFFAPHVDKIIRQLKLDSTMIEIEEGQYMLGKLKDKVDLPAKVEDYIRLLKINGYLSNLGFVSKTVEVRQENEPLIKTKEYKEIIKTLFAKYEHLMPGQAAPDVEIIGEDGKKYHLSDFRGQLLIVDVWATFCGPCKAEAPIFDELAKKYKGKAVKFIGLSKDDRIERWQDYLKEHKKYVPQYYTNGINLKAYQVVGIPRFFVISKDGKIIDAFAPRPSSGELEEMIKSHLVN